ncbi:hypothetical protein KUTeg_022744 [Tegillarca granosa]|uniref:RING-type E3 ubiquitin transferase n=1 Tax=Tegillarca granosa TaxID=220873 RepID=A0ABQ9DZK9_TEGGR|nr:hypothetical protein KUTeg_022744 [Tegillarca granosa]
MFGQSCIEKWLKGQGGKCPQCNAKAKRQDIRVLYAKSLKAVDTTERDQALKELEREREVRKRIEMEAAQNRLQCQLATQECTPTTSGAFSESQVSMSQQNRSQLAGQFMLDKTIKIWEAGNCRVMSYSGSLATLVVSQPSSSPLFPGFGVKKISAMDFKTAQYLTIHSKPIRDVCFHPFTDDGVLLSCGLDKTIKMTSIISNAVVQTYDVDAAVWSCVWNSDDRNLLYAGLQNGRVLEFDIRNTGTHVQQLNTEGNRSVVSLQYVPKDQQGAFRLHMLPLEGILTSLCFEPTTRHILASFRPTAKHPTIRHQMCELVSRSFSTDPTVIDNICSCNIIHTFHSSRSHTMLSKTKIFPHPADENRLLACAGEESSNAVHVWDTSTGQLKQQLHTGGIVVDLCSINVNQQTYLAALTSKLNYTSIV